MQAARKLVRWPLVITLGGVLGILYVLLGLALTPSATPRSGIVATMELQQSRPVGKPMRPSEDALRDELTEVVNAQLQAFRQDNYPAAYRFAATILRDNLPLPAFEKMVRTGYPAIAHSRSATFGTVLDNGEDAVVTVIILSESHRVLHYQYLLRNERTGWKINGVRESTMKSTLASNAGQLPPLV